MLRNAVLKSLLGLLIVVLVGNVLPLDLWVQKFFYLADEHRWLIDRNNTILHSIFYTGPKIAIILFAISIGLSLIFFKKHDFVRQHYRGLLIVLASLLLVPTLVGLLKTWTNMPCPKSLISFNGQYEQVSLFTIYDAVNRPPKRQRCFPAAHASAGFALMSLYFLFLSPKHRKQALLASVLLGWLLGGYKMLIGDHFFSHTLVSMLLAWMTINIIANSLDKYCKRFSRYENSLLLYS